MATTTGKLFTQDERKLCEKIAALGVSPASQRAKALLFLDDGHTQVKSGELSSLTLGQIRYLVRLFRQKGMDLFPSKIKTTSPTEPEISGKNPINNLINKKKKKKSKKKKKEKKEKKSPNKKKKKTKKAEKKKDVKSKVKKKKKGKKKK